MGPTVFNDVNSQLDYLKLENKAKKAVVLFHGYGASMYDLYGIANAVDPKSDYDWYFPNGHIPLNMGMMMSRAWFNIDMNELELAMQAGTHREFFDKYPEEFRVALTKSKAFITPLLGKYDELILGGFSQGAMLATHLSAMNLNHIRKLICFSGTLIGQNELSRLIESDNKLHFFQSHGKSDPVLSYDHAKKLFELLKLEGHQGEFVSFDGAHEIPMDVIRKCERFLAQ